MNRGLTLLLCAVALMTVGVANTQATDIAISLNLRYTDPADPSEGGTWTLVASSSEGIAGIRTIISDVDNASLGTILSTDIAALDPIDSMGPNERPAVLAIPGGVDLLYGQDLSAGATRLDGVGTAATSDGPDVLNNPTWDVATIIGSGTFSTATRPTLSAVGLDMTDGNTYLNFAAPTVAAATATITATVRGDSLNTLGLESPAGAGLLAGDYDRNGVVDGLDLATLAGNFTLSGLGWDDGDSTDDGSVNGLDLADLAANFTLSSIPPAIAAVPEPSTLSLVGFAGLALLRFRSRRNKISG